MEPIDVTKYWIFRLRGTKDWYCLSPPERGRLDKIAHEHYCSITDLSSVPKGIEVIAYPISGDKKHVYISDARQIEVSQIEPTL